MSKTTLSIVFLAHPQPRQSGDWLHRGFWPAQALGTHAEIHLVQTTHPDWLSLSLAADVLVILMLTDPLLLEIIAQRQQKGKATVYEISDDFKAFHDSNAQQGHYSQPYIQHTIETLARTANAVQYSSPFLQQKYAYLNPTTKLLRNQLPANASSPSARTSPNHPLIMGWSGSAGHLQDVTELACWLAAWSQHQQVIWRIMAAPALIEAFERAGLTIEATPTGAMDHYLAFLGDLDISLIWTGDDDFSRGRSDGKFLESASQGTAVLCRRSVAYEGSIEHTKTGLFFETERDLHNLLDRLIATPEIARSLGDAALSHVRQYRTHTHAALERLDFYAGLTTMRSGATRHFVNCFLEPAENLLYTALTHHRANDWDNALICAVEVMEQGAHSLLLWQLLQDISTRLGLAENAALCEQRAGEWLNNQLNQFSSGMDCMPCQ